MKFCSNCGETVARRIPAGDTRERYVCESCEAIHYQNPRVVTGCLIIHGEQVLLARRAIAPREGFWTLPAGFLENGETCEAGAVRETLEEVRATVDVHGLYTVFSLPHISQMYLFYRSTLTVNGDDAPYECGDESLEVGLFNEADIPWDELAFPVIRDTLRHYFEDRKAGDFPVHTTDIIIDRKRHPLR